MGPNNRIGSVCRATTSPTWNPEWVRVNTSQDWAMLCIQVPMRDRLWPAK